MKIVDFNYIYNFFMVLCVFFSILVIISKNPMHSIMFLICVFLNIFFIILLQDLEYLSVVFLIIYVGAVAVLFLFVIYMLNIRTIELMELNWQYLTGLFISFIFLLLLIFFFHKSINISFYNGSLFYEKFFYLEWINFLFDYNNLNLISKCLYTDYGVIVVFVGLILLVAIVGAVSLNLDNFFFKKEQNNFKQIKRFIKDD